MDNKNTVYKRYAFNEMAKFHWERNHLARPSLDKEKR